MRPDTTEYGAPPLAGKTAIITGAGAGIGRACAEDFARAGARVVVSDISGDAARATVQAIVAAGGTALAQTTDATDARQVQQLVDVALREFGRIDILFNNAGGAFPQPTHEMSLDTYRQIIALNLDSVFFGIHAVLPTMLQQRSGVILSTTSGAGLNAVTGLAAYGAAKAGVISLMKNIATEFGGQGIRANAIAPGPMDTPGLNAWLSTFDDGPARYAAQVPSGRLGTAEDIARAAVFLASDAAAFINGIVLPVDGAIQARLATPQIV
jgi:NAD(P)-dependent dehydrogenase (short-subunit alcohol dehydrogenase family)